MKIALCGRFHTKKKHQGGSAEVFLKLAELLSKKHELTLFGRGKPTKEIIEMCKKNNIQFHYIPSDSLLNILLGPFRARSLLKKNWENFDLIHTHTGSFAWASIKFKKKCKIITHIHEISIPYKDSLQVTAYKLMQNLLLKKASKKSDLVITISNYMKKLIKKKWGIKKITIIPNGIDLELFNLDDKIKSKTKRVLFVGRLTKRKGILELIDGFKKIKDTKYCLSIIGLGELESEIKERIKDDKRIKFIGYVNNRDLPKYYNSSDLLVVPSYYEPSGLVPRESLACGTPVLLAKNTGLKEIKFAYFFNNITPDEISTSITNVLSKKTFARKILRDYSEENFNWEKILNKYEETYKNILK